MLYNPNTLTKLISTSLVGSALLFSAACNPDKSPLEPRDDATAGQAQNPDSNQTNQETPYNKEAGAYNLALGAISCNHLQAEYVKGANETRQIRVTATVKEMPEDPIMDMTIQSSEEDYDIARSGDGIVVRGDTVSTVVDASPVGYGARAFVIVKFPTANGHYGGTECPRDGV